MSRLVLTVPRKKQLTAAQLKALFPRACLGNGLPSPVEEYRFAPPRRWRFDYAWPGYKVACECEGGVFVRGRHSRGAGMVKDMEKYSEAAALGWRLVRVTPQQLCEAQTFDWLRRALAA